MQNLKLLFKVCVILFGIFTAKCSIKDIPGSSSAYTQILDDTANKKVYLLKEMYLLRGNENGTYGYLREIWHEELRTILEE